MDGTPDGSGAGAPSRVGERGDDAGSSSWSVRWARIGLRLVDEKMRRRPSQRTERILLAVSLVAFVVLGVLAATHFPDVGTGVRWEVLLPVGIIGMSLNLVLNALEFEVTARFVGRRIPLLRAMRITIMGSAANLLPLPGGALVRVQALAADGARYRHTLTAAAVMGGMAVGASFVLVGLTNVADIGVGVLLALLTAGLLVFVIATAMLRTASDTRRATRFALLAFGLEALYLMVASVRLWLIFIGLGVEVSLPAAFALSGVGTVASAAGIFPGELGIKEALIGLVSPLVGVPVAVGVTGAVVARLFGFAVLSVASCFLLVTDAVRRSRQKRPSDAGTGVEAEVG